MNANDIVTDLEVATSGGQVASTTDRFFKSMTTKFKKTTVVHTIMWQLSHVRNNCLSDPPASLVKIIRVNPTTNKALTGRSTGGNEADHRGLNRMVATPSIGVPRADRVFGDYYEESNGRKSVSRLGEPEPLTHRTDIVYLANSVGKEAGFDAEDLPPMAAAPAKLPFEEHMGLTYNLPEQFQLTEASVEDIEGTGEDGVEDLANFLADIEFTEEDIPMDATQFTQAGNQQQEEDDDFKPIRIREFDEAMIESEVAKHHSNIVKNESTFDAFCRLTQGQPWVELANPDKPASQLSDLQKEEHALFDQLVPKYPIRKANIDSAAGYRTFEKEWDKEVSDRFHAKIAGNDNVILIHRKMYWQLQAHFGKLEKIRATQALNLARRTDPALVNFNNQVRDSRRNMPQHQSAHYCHAPQYNPQHGLPPPWKSDGAEHRYCGTCGPLQSAAQCPLPICVCTSASSPPNCGT